MSILTAPEDFSDAAWTTNRASVTVNQITAPDGTLTADLFSDDNSGGNNTSRLRQVFSGIATSTIHTMSIFVQANGVDWLNWRIQSLGTVDVDSYADVANGVEGDIGSSATASGIEEYPNSWYRPWITFVSDASDNAGLFDLFLADGNNDNSVPIDGTSSLYVWGSDLRPGALQKYVSQAGVVVGGSSSPNPGLGFGKMGRMGA